MGKDSFMEKRGSMDENLKLLGLNSYEAKAYGALLYEGASTAHAVSRKSGVPSGKIYPVLDSLAGKGLVVITRGRPKIFQAVSPEIAVEKVMQKKKQEIRLMEKNARALVENYAKIQKVNIKKEESDIVETYLGHGSAFARSVILHNRAEKYWKTISRLTLRKEHLDACSNAVKRGVAVLAITSRAETTPERVKQWKKRGMQVRFLEELPFRLSIYDDKGVIFRFAHGKQYISTHIKNGKLARGMSLLFDSLWEKANKA